MSAATRTVTTVVPVFNGARFLDAAIASIAAQAAGRVRAVIVDDGSTDDSPERIAALAARHDWIVPVRHGANRGVAAARNTGIAAADTPFIAFLDQDDRWAAGKLDRQLAALAAAPALDFVLGLQTFHLEPGVARPRWAKDRFFDGPQPGFVFGAILARRGCFARTGPLDESLRHGTDDVDWYARARAAGLAHVMQEEVVLHRTVHDGNASRLTAHSNPELLRVMHRAILRRRSGSGAA